MSDERRKAIRERVLALLDAHNAGTVDNWRDGNEGYWVGVAEGAYDAEAERDRSMRESARLITSAELRAQDAEGEIGRLRAVVEDAQARVTAAGKRAEAAESALSRAREVLQDFADQHRCGCGHPACNRCADDREAASVLSPSPPPSGTVHRDDGQGFRREP